MGDVAWTAVVGIAGIAGTVYAAWMSGSHARRLAREERRQVGYVEMLFLIRHIGGRLDDDRYPVVEPMVIARVLAVVAAHSTSRIRVLHSAWLDAMSAVETFDENNGRRPKRDDPERMKLSRKLADAMLALDAQVRHEVSDTERRRWWSRPKSGV